jgi:hypothetical protein
MSFLFCFLIFFVVVALSFGVLSQCQSIPSIPEWTNCPYDFYGPPESIQGRSAPIDEYPEEEIPILIAEPVAEEESAAVLETPVEATIDGAKESEATGETEATIDANKEESIKSEQDSSAQPQTLAAAQEPPEKPTKVKASKTTRTVKAKKKTTS